MFNRKSSWVFVEKVARCRLPVAGCPCISPLWGSRWAGREGLPLHLPSAGKPVGQPRGVAPASPLCGKAGGQAERGWGCVKLPVAGCLLPVRV